jgi:flagellar motility protein MotE (MotC chaperone)
MKSKKLLGRLNDFLSADEKTQKQEIKSARKVLKALKDKENELKTRLENSSHAEETDALQTRLDVIYAQRSKGVELVKRLRGSKGSSDDKTGDQ